MENTSLNHEPAQLENTTPMPVSGSMISQKLLLVVLVVLLPVVGVGGYLLGVRSQSGGSEIPIVEASPLPDEGVACTMDAKICPDGSAVGRSGPNCEFAECPQTAQTSSVETDIHRGSHFSIEYPRTWQVWSYGRGISLEYFQLNSLLEAEMATAQTRAHISFDIQEMGYTEDTTLAEKKASVEDWNSELLLPYSISETMVSGVPALVYERDTQEQNFQGHPTYEKTYWLVRNNVKYIVSIIIFAQDSAQRDADRERFEKDFDAIVASMKFLK